MGIYIPNIEMPKACCFCELYEPDLYWCRAMKKDIDVDKYESVSPFCPLVPVPDHGRCVDVEPLTIYMLNEHYNHREVVLWKDILNAPTILPADKEDS